MEIKLSKRRVCGDDWATDIFLPRRLQIYELESLNHELCGVMTRFGSLFYLDFQSGRLTASNNGLRCTFRTSLDNPKEEDIVLGFFKKLLTAKTLEMAN